LGLKKGTRQSVYQVPDGFTWLGRESVGGVPVVVILMLGLYALTGHVVGSTVLGRYILATGSNPVAAYLAGVPVKRVQRIVYATSGALAALGGVILASQLKSGAPTYGQMYELYVIAAVVVGGTSLSGGQGSVWGTLVGALLIAVIQNGMNLLGMESYTQKIVLGLVLLAAVLADRMRRT
jgi:ribose transport system permease protein